MRRRDAPRSCARAISLANKEYRALRDDDDECGKTIGQTGLTTTRKRKARDHLSWRLKGMKKYMKRGKLVGRLLVERRRCVEARCEVVECLNILVRVVPCCRTI